MKWKVVPMPSLESTQRVPPISVTRRWAIVVPRPVPPNRRVMLRSAWVKLSNMVSSWDGGMPIPVSATENWRISGPWEATLTTTVPFPCGK